MAGLNVLVSGASIAGPMTAYWLAKAGAKVTVVERFPSLRTGGQNIDIRTIGLEVMRMIPGMEAAVKAKKYDIDGLSLIRSDGRPYGTLKPTGNPDQQTLISEYEILRGDLSRIIVDLTKDNENVQYVFGEQVTTMQQPSGDGPITVEFANGFPSSDYDLVVACDGTTSRTRALGLGCGVRDHVVSTNCWSAYFRMPQDLLQGKKIGLGYNAPGGRMIGVAPDAGANRVFMMSAYPKSEHDAMLQFRGALKQGDQALKEFVARRYENVGWKDAEILGGLMKSDDLYASEICQVKAPILQKGRFVMVGDAGYASGLTGVGTSLAMAGAYVLAGEISEHKNDIRAGLQAYEQRMRPLINDFGQMPRFVTTVMAPQTAWGIWLRNNIFGFVLWTGILNYIQKFMGSALQKTPKDLLPIYKPIT
ncbi:oxidoreductase [Xylaria bambusicola]|uniref:oxidoreductase n=1 Tax=Xylaria bambusicola TaxID=326684 RepID=UPI00200741FF|nr:oxidoreductase [Xylaria bambusicola]KAI0521190.1 oxidoreductase [Xylaria bambusicola]